MPRVLILLLLVLFVSIFPGRVARAEGPHPASPTPQAGRGGPVVDSACNTVHGGVVGEAIRGTIGATVHEVEFAGAIDVGTPLSFCTSLIRDIEVGDCVSMGGAEPNAQIAWLLVNYPPVAGLTADEAAARQAAIWYFTDNFVVTGPAAVVARAQGLIAGVPANPSLDITITIANPNRLVDVSTPGALTQRLTLTVTRFGRPLAGQIITLTTDYGVLSLPSVQTDANGQAMFSITNPSPAGGAAGITAAFPYEKMVANRYVVLNDSTKQSQGIVDRSPTTASAAASVVWRQSPTAIKLATFGATANPTADLLTRAMSSSNPLPWRAAVVGLAVLAFVGYLARRRG